MLKFNENYEPTAAELEWLRAASEKIGTSRDWKADLARMRDEMIMFGSTTFEVEAPPADSAAASSPYD